MDAEHRHELKTNELADWIGHFPDFCRKNAKTIIGVALIIAAVGIYFYSRRVRTKAQFEQEAQAVSLIERLNYSKLMTIRSQTEKTPLGDSIQLMADSLKMAAAEAKSPHVAALLLIKQGDGLRADLHYRAEEVDPDVVENTITQARTAYDKALIQAQGNNTLIAMANFGLGMCAEEIGDYTKAEIIYNAIIDDTSFAGTVLPRQAQARLDNMQDNRMQFVFVAAALPKTEDIKIEPPTPKPALPDESKADPNNTGALPKPEDIKIESPTPKPVLQDAPKPDPNRTGTVEIKPTGDNAVPPVEPPTEEQDTSESDPNAAGAKETETN